MAVTGLEQARAAYARGDWVTAFTGWSTVEPTTLSSQELDDLATAAGLLGRHVECVAALQHAFTRAQGAGDLPHAVRRAFRLAMTTATHGQQALSAGWAARAEESSRASTTTRSSAAGWPC